MFASVWRRTRAWWAGHRLPVWYDPSYRLPLSGLEGGVGMEPRRADFVAWYLVDRAVVSASALRTPAPVSWEALARVHATTYLESLSDREVLSRIFAARPAEIPADELIHSFRLACGGTVEATRETLRTGRPALNLLGGFHHAYPHSGGGFCPVNDIAVAVAAARADGFRGRVAVLDFDAHPPDGTAACFAEDPLVWIGSLSAVDWGPMPGVDETVLPAGCGDRMYLATLRELLDRMPRVDLAFVLAGGDVLAGDRLGGLGLSLAGARRRDRMVRETLSGVPSVWLPAGGYHSDAWRILAGTALVLARGSERPISENYDPLRARFAFIAETLDRDDLGEAEDDFGFRGEDVMSMLGLGGARPKLVLDYYTKQGLEFALYRYGVFAHLRRLGYRNFRVATENTALGDRLCLLATAEDREHLLIECVLEKKCFDGRDFLYVHWLTLRDPRGGFSPKHPQLPGQDAPGLGLAREISEMLLRMATRLKLQGVAFSPSWYHVAYVSRRQFRFLDPRRQGRFEAMVRDLSRIPLLEATNAVAEGRVRLDGEPYQWEADPMVFRAGEVEDDRAIIDEERERVRFEVSPAREATAHNG